ncbi:hypothetical protein [Mesorhizobium sp. M0217]|uniref:hypothetical protein n=1 Tax=unclassified Mesorhizobium TaxID=325217 RepID=UPI00333C57C5
MQGSAQKVFDSEISRERPCQNCGTSLEGRRADAKYCSAYCRVNAHRIEVGRVEEITAQAIIDRPMRDALIETGDLNPQDEHNPEKLREAFNSMCRRFLKKYA